MRRVLGVGLCVAAALGELHQRSLGSGFNIHQIWHHEFFIILSFIAGGIILLASYTRPKYRGYLCEKCNIMFGNKELFLKHRKTFHYND